MQLLHCSSSSANVPASGWQAGRARVQVLVRVLGHRVAAPAHDSMREDLVGFIMATGTVHRLDELFSLFDRPQVGCSPLCAVCVLGTAAASWPSTLTACAYRQAIPLRQACSTHGSPTLTSPSTSAACLCAAHTNVYRESCSQRPWSASKQLSSVCTTAASAAGDRRDALPRLRGAGAAPA